MPDIQPTLYNNDSFTFVTRSEYFNELIAKLEQAKNGDRITIATHVLDVNEPIIAKLVEVLSAAAQRGVEIKLALDERTLPIMQRIPLNRTKQALIHKTSDSLQRLQTAGVSYAIINKTFKRLINQYAGRLHIKVATINDEVYIGGCNLASDSQIDMMVHWNDPKLAKWLYELISTMIQKQSSRLSLGTKDQEILLDKNTKLLLDVGKPKQSIIYEQALLLIDNAQDWIVMTCQFFPNSTTARHLALAYNRGVDVSLYFNHPSKHRPGHNILHHVVLLHERTRRPSALFKQQLSKDLPFVHAKLLATEHGAMIGSHNYVAAGVNFGTVELTLVRYDNQFARNSVQHFLKQLASAKI
ncbi:MAG: phospholipase D-like domain-containing protein [Candidatus Saccharimonadales bacterium]